jgi:uncharacterized membrane protein
MVKRIACTILLIVLSVLLVPQSVLAIDSPVLTEIVQVNVYGDLIEPGDQLYVVEFNTVYVSNTTPSSSTTTGNSTSTTTGNTTSSTSTSTSTNNAQTTGYPTETVNEALLVRLFNDSNIEIAATAPFTNPYFHLGWGRNIASFYFSSADVVSNSIDWDNANYYMKLEGNPSLSWNGTSVDESMFITVWTNTGAASALSYRVIYLATKFQAAWGYGLIESGSLTAAGANYFSSTIPQLRSIAPTIFESWIQQASFPKRQYGLGYIFGLRSQWTGTWFDMTQAAADWGVADTWIYGFLWAIITFGIGWILVFATKTNKFLTMYAMLMVMFGTFAGMLSWVVGAFFGIIAIVAIIYQFVYKQSSA